MSFIKKHQHLVQYKSELLSIYLIDKVLYMEIMNKGKGNIRKKLEDKIQDFSVCLDNSNLIHIICIDTFGKLIHLYSKNNIWKKITIPKFASNFSEIKDLKVYSNGDTIHLILLKHDNSNDKLWSLIHFLMDKNTWNIFEIEGIFIDQYFSPYKIDMDNDKNIHLIYKSIKNGKYVLFYKMFNSKYNQWSISVKLNSTNINTMNIFILCDTNNFTHVVWSSLYNKNIKTNYLKKKPTSTVATGWQKSKTFPKNISNFTNPILIQSNDDIKLLCKQNDKFYITKTKTTKDSWKPIKAIKSSLDFNLSLITYIGNSYKNYNIIKVPLSYGYCDSEIFILGLDEMEQKITSSKFSSNETLKKTSVSISSSFEDYIENVTHQFKKTDITFDLYCNKKNVLQNTNIDFHDIKDINNKEVLDKVLNLYSEMKSLKTRETEIMDLLSETKNNYADLSKKVKDILNCSD